MDLTGENKVLILIDTDYFQSPFNSKAASAQMFAAAKNELQEWYQMTDESNLCTYLPKSWYDADN